MPKPEITLTINITTKADQLPHALATAAAHCLIPANREDAYKRISDEIKNTFEQVLASIPQEDEAAVLTPNRADFAAQMPPEQVAAITDQMKSVHPMTQRIAQVQAETAYPQQAAARKEEERLVRLFNGALNLYTFRPSLGGGVSIEVLSRQQGSQERHMALHGDHAVNRLLARYCKAAAAHATTPSSEHLLKFAETLACNAFHAGLNAADRRCQPNPPDSWQLFWRSKDGRPFAIDHITRPPAPTTPPAPTATEPAEELTPIMEFAAMAFFAGARAAGHSDADTVPSDEWSAFCRKPETVDFARAVLDGASNTRTEAKTQAAPTATTEENGA